MEVGEVFATFFSGLRLTISDLIAALLLVRVDQHQRRDPFPTSGSRIREKTERLKGAVKLFREEDVEGQNAPYSVNQAMLDLQDVVDLQAHMLGINGYMMYLYMNMLALKPLTGARKLLKMPTAVRPRFMRSARNTHAPFQQEEGGEKAREDFCCGWNHQALIYTAELDPNDIVYARYNSYAGRVAGHAIAVDKKLKAIVIMFRGSLSLADFLTDGMVTPESLQRAGKMWNFDGKGHYAHKGMLVS